MASAGLAAAAAWPADPGNLVAANWPDPLPKTSMSAMAIQTGVAEGGARSLVIEVRQRSEPPYERQVGWPLEAGFDADHVIALSFKARSPTRNPVRVVVEQRGPPFRPAVDINVPALSEQWAVYSGTQTVVRAFAAGDLAVRVQVGHREGTLEIAEPRVADLGPDPAMAAARQAVEPSEIKRRIQTVREVDLIARVRSAAGQPVSGATVTVAQVRHTFLFGCNIFLLDPENREEWQTAYQRRFVELLNYATLPFYWGSYEPRPGQTGEARLKAMARWCADHGLEAKGHPICWHEVWPRWAPAGADDAIPLLKARVETLPSLFAPWVRYWDVWNEANAAIHHAKTGVGDWVRRDGPARPVSQALQWARAAAPAGTVLLYNDFDITPANVRLLEQLREMGTVPDAIGIQSHMHGGVWPDGKTWATLERFARFDRPLHLTEVTIASGGRMPETRGRRRFDPGEWPTTPDGEARQAAEVVRFYSILVSHPAVEAITWWDFSDRGAWKSAPAGLVRADMSPKPAYDRLRRLVRGEWWTRASAVTGPDGTARLRVWRAAHRVQATAGGQSAAADLVVPQRGPPSVSLDLRLE